MEEIRLEDDKVSQKSNSENGSVKITGTVKKKLLHFLTVMTIEPMMFVQAFGWQITSIAQSQMILYKTCRGKILIDNNCQAQGQGQRQHQTSKLDLEVGFLMG